MDLPTPGFLRVHRSSSTHHIETREVPPHFGARSGMHHSAKTRLDRGNIQHLHSNLCQRAATKTAVTMSSTSSIQPPACTRPRGREAPHRGCVVCLDFEILRRCTNTDSSRCRSAKWLDSKLSMTQRRVSATDFHSLLRTRILSTIMMLVKKHHGVRSHLATRP